jgi:MFS family permease
MFLASLADLYGRRPTTAAMLALAGAATIGAGYATDTNQLVALRFAGGLGLGALVATLAPLVSEYSPRQHRTFILAVIFTAGPLGPVIGGVIVAPLVGEHGWRIVFIWAGIITFVIAALTWLVVPESIAFILKRQPAGALEKVNRILRYIRQQPVERLPDVQGGTTTESASVKSLLVPNRRITTLFLWSTFFLSFATVYFLTSWLPKILVDVGFPQDRAILGAVMLPAGSVVGAPLVGFIAKRVALHKVITASFVAGGIAVLILAAVVREDATSGMIWPLLFVVGLTLFGGFINLYTLAVSIYPAQVRSTGIGWAAGLGRGGAVLSPALAGMMIAWGVTSPALFLYFGVPAFLAAACVMMVVMREMD